MKARILILSLVGGLIVLAAWLVHTPRSAQADEIPEKYRDTVKKGLEYLVKSQHKDGHWEGDDGKHPVAMTGLAGLALVMEGRINYMPSTAKCSHAVEIRKAVDWLMANSRPGRDGLIFSEHPSETDRYMLGHGLATLFLAGALDFERDEARGEKLTKVLTAAVKYIMKARSSGGGWYYTSKAEGHDLDETLPTVIQIQALQAVAASEGGIPVDAVVMNDAVKYLKAAIAKYDRKGAAQSANRLPETAAALICWANVGGILKIEDEFEKCKQDWFSYCQTAIPARAAVRSGRDELAHYYYAQTVSRLKKNDAWPKYSTALFDHLQTSQNKDGSWPVPKESEGGISVGPVYSAALWCTVLQLGKGGHPSVPRLLERL